MKAVVFDAYGPADVLAIAEVPTPTPTPNEVRVKVHASTVSAEDPKLRAFDHPPLFWLPIGLIFGFPRPRVRILGMELSGEIDAVGRDVERFKVGDRVFGYTGIRLGAHAEYRCLPESSILTRKPEALSFAEAAAIPNGALTALVYLRNMAKLEAGERILILGASGAVGTAAVQLAKHFGAHVTGVCSSRNMELVRSLGADEVIDYTNEDFTCGTVAYDVVFDTVATTSLARVKPVLTSQGRYLVTQFGARELWQMAWTAIRGGKRILGGASNFHWTVADLEWLASLFQSKHLKAVIDRQYTMDEVVLAHRYVEQKHKRGNVVLTFVSGPSAHDGTGAELTAALGAVEPGARSQPP